MTRTIASRLSAAFIAGILAAVLVPSVFAGPAAATPQTSDLTAAFRTTNPAIEDLRVVEVGGIVVIRGRAADKSIAEAAGATARGLGYERVANLVQIVAPIDDEAIERRAERALGSQRGLDGCNFQIDSNKGVVTLAGTVVHELQKDMAVQVLRSVDGVRFVTSDLRR
jgi:osmotically-inducible protein OsmY